VYKGLTLGAINGIPLLYATNFRSGRVDVFNARFTQLHIPHAFVDPNLPAGFAPFNIQRIGAVLLVTYAVQDGPKHDDVAGAGNGIVDVYAMNGHFLKRFATGGTLNSPWGATIAPRSFGAYAGDILVGNFGDGRINVFSRRGQFINQLDDANGSPISIDGLWALTPGTLRSGNATGLFFSAGTNGEADGLFGKLTGNGATVVSMLPPGY
jgi:uncharacterized protein (TIGR03118 family)